MRTTYRATICVKPGSLTAAAWVTFNTTFFTAAWNATNHTPPDHVPDPSEVGPATWVAGDRFEPLAVELCALATARY